MMKEAAVERKMLCTHKFVHAHVDFQKVLQCEKSYAHVSVCTPSLTCTLCSSLFSPRAMGRLTSNGKIQRTRKLRYVCIEETGSPLPRSSLSSCNISVEPLIAI